MQPRYVDSQVKRGSGARDLSRVNLSYVPTYSENILD